MSGQQEGFTELGTHPLADLPPLRPTHAAAPHAAHGSFYGVDHYGLHDATGHRARRAPPARRAGAGDDPAAAAASTAAVNAAVAAAAAATDRWCAWREAAASRQQPSSHPPPAFPPPVCERKLSA